jgi:hypothetical protein
MKHLLNNIPQEEKNRILEQHKGGKSIDTTRFKALLESKSGNVKPLIMEGPTGNTQTTGVGTKPNTPSVGTKPNTPSVGTKPQQGNEYVDTSNWVKVIAYSDEAATQAITNIQIDPQMIGLEGNNVKFTYKVAGKNGNGAGIFDCNSKNTMQFDGKPLSGTMYISDARVDTLKSKCGSNQGYASTNTGVDKNMA